MKISEILVESNYLDKAELLLALGRESSPDQEPLDYKKLLNLVDSLKKAYQSNPTAKSQVKSAAVLLSSIVADYISVIDKSHLATEQSVQALRKEVSDIQQVIIDLYNS